MQTARSCFESIGHIRTKLDYGSSIYIVTCKSYLKKLQTIHNQGLRLSLGAFRTSPTQSLYIKANEPPLTLSWEKFTPIHIKTSIQPKQSNSSKNSQLNHFLSRKPFSYPPFGLCIKEAIQQIRQNTNNISPLTMRNLPPWIITKPHIDLTLIQQEKTHPATSSAKNRFKEFRDKYSGHTAFYTDRSKTIDRTGAAFTNINNYKQIRLPNVASIYLAELQAIKMALDMIKNSEIGKSMIFSDSLFSLVAIQEGNQNHPYIQ